MRYLSLHYHVANLALEEADTSAAGEVAECRSFGEHGLWESHLLIEQEVLVVEVVAPGSGEPEALLLSVCRWRAARIPSALRVWEVSWEALGEQLQRTPARLVLVDRSYLDGMDCFQGDK